MKSLAGNEPLLYIKQPNFNKPKSFMQTEFMSEKQALSIDNKTKDKSTDKKLDASFNDLSIDEKINYLLAIPNELFQLRCQVITQDKTYYGRITEKEKTSIRMIHSGKQLTSIEIDQIKQIKLLGL